MEAFARGVDGRPTLSLSYEDASLADQVAHWVTSLEQRLHAGETFPPDIMILLDGWPFATRAAADLVELHAMDMTGPNDAPARYARTADPLLKLALAQREAAASYGLLEEFTPPHAMMTVTCCTKWERMGDSVLARTHIAGNESGWVLNCSRTHGESKHDHAPAGDWTKVPVFELVKRRASLVRFLGFPVGSGIEIDGEGKTIVSVLETGMTLHGLRNVAFTVAAPSWVHQLYRTVKPRQGSSEHRRVSDAQVVRLDFERDAALLEASGREVSAMLCERFGIGAEAAKQTLDYYHSRTGRLERWHWKFRDVPAEVRTIVEPMLDDPSKERWRLHQATARALRQHDGGAFLTHKNLVEEMDKAWQSFAFYATLR